MVMPQSSDAYRTTLEDPFQRRTPALEYLQASTSATLDDVVLLLIEKVQQLETELAALRDAHNAHIVH